MSESNNLDGQTISEDSPTSDPKVDPPKSELPALPPVVEQGTQAVVDPRNPIDELNPEQKKTLRKMGLTARMAKKVLRGNGDGKWMNIRVVGHISLIFTANSLDQLQIAQRKANKMASDKNVDPKTRIAALAVVAQCGQSIAATVKTNVDIATNMDLIDKPKGDEDKKPAAVTMNFNNFPPVKSPEKAIDLVASSGQE